MGRIRAVVLVSCLTFLALLLRLQDGKDRKVFTTLEERLHHEQEILAAVCAEFTTIDTNIDSGALKFLHRDLQSFEATIAAGLLHSCTAAGNTKSLEDGIGRLKKHDIFKRCAAAGECNNLLPALQTLQSSLSRRNGQINDLKRTLDLLDEITPNCSQKAKDKSSENSMIHNIYFFIRIIFSEAFGSLNIIRSVVYLTSDILSETLQLIFRIFLIIAVFHFAPKSVWSLHLFLMKISILFLFLVIGLGFWNYAAAFKFGIEYRILRRGMENSIFVVNDVDYITEFGTFSEFEAAADRIHGNLGGGFNRPVVKHKQTFTQKEPQSDYFQPRVEKAFEFQTIMSELQSLDRIKTEDYKGLCAMAGKTDEKFAKHLRSLTETLAVSRNFYQLAAKRFGAQIAPDRVSSISSVQLESMRLKSQGIEEGFARQEAKLLQYFVELNEVETEIVRLEGERQARLVRVGSLALLAVPAALPVFGSTAALGLASLAAAGLQREQSSGGERAAALAAVQAVNNRFKQFTKESFMNIDACRIWFYF